MRAYALELEGDVSLDCLVSAEGRLDCAIVSEDPTGFGFGEAALRISRSFRMALMTLDGVPAAGGRYRMRIPFRFADS
ncbi:MAG: TonB family protein [Terricaulis sp.]